MRRVAILGAGGKDFHVFLTLYRDAPDAVVVFFTATQIPGIEKRVFPASLAGPRYPNGIPIYAESELATLIRRHRIDEVVFAYSDVSYEYVEERRRLAESNGAKFVLPDPKAVMLEASKPVVAVCAVRTGAGKSPTSRLVVSSLRAHGKRVIVLRHPMPYGHLEKQRVQRFEKLEDMEKADCTIEEMEEYEPHIRDGAVVMAGVDYKAILEEAEKEADVVVWDGGNNDTPFIKPTVHITLVDPLRAGHELTYYPGRENFLLADVLLVSKVDMATKQQLETVKKNIREHNPDASVLYGVLEVEVEDEKAVKGKRVLVVEDGPTTTHGEMGYGAGVVAAERCGAAELINPRSFAVGSLAQTLAHYPHITRCLPALGYGKEMIEDLRRTIERAQPELVVVATPIDLRRVLKLQIPSVRVTYRMRIVEGSLEKVLEPVLLT
ncbi:MAG: GTPase [Planctomycetota bacterium]|nr:MAG: GTPase [Planctomycetota bacterium]